MIVLAVTWKANQGHEADVATLFSTLQDASRKEPGCLMYIVHRHKTDQRRFFIYEQYQDDAALEAFDDLVRAESELERLAARARAVEDRSVRERAAVLDAHEVAHLRFVAAAERDFDDLDVREPRARRAADRG